MSLLSIRLTRGPLSRTGYSALRQASERPEVYNLLRPS